MPDTEKINNPVILVPLATLFSWILGLALDNTIQDGIKQNPDLHSFYQLLQNILGIENIISIAMIIVWVIGIIIYFFKKFSK